MSVVRRRPAPPSGAWRQLVKVSSRPVLPLEAAADVRDGSFIRGTPEYGDELVTTPSGRVRTPSSAYVELPQQSIAFDLDTICVEDEERPVMPALRDLAGSPLADPHHDGSYDTGPATEDGIPGDPDVRDATEVDPDTDESVDHFRTTG